MNVTVRQVREALQAHIAAKSSIATDIRELNYQGSDFAYPCVRWDCICEPDHCDDLVTNFTVYCWSEEPSSLEATRIIDEIAVALNNHDYHGAIQLQNILLLSVPAVVRDDRLWRGEAYFKCLATN